MNSLKKINVGFISTQPNRCPACGHLLATLRTSAGPRREDMRGTYGCTACGATYELESAIGSSVLTKTRKASHGGS